MGQVIFTGYELFDFHVKSFILGKFKSSNLLFCQAWHLNRVKWKHQITPPHPNHCSHGNENKSPLPHPNHCSHRNENIKSPLPHPNPCSHGNEIILPLPHPNCWWHGNENFKSPLSHLKIKWSLFSMMGTQWDETWNTTSKLVTMVT